MVASIAIEELLKRNPSIAKSLPLVGALSGFSEMDKEPEESKKSEKSTTFNEVTNDDPFVNFAKDLSSMFTTDELGYIVDIMNYLHHDKNKISTVLDLIKQ